MKICLLRGVVSFVVVLVVTCWPKIPTTNRGRQSNQDAAGREMAILNERGRRVGECGCGDGVGGAEGEFQF